MFINVGLQNDHKELMAQIEEGLYTIHAEVKAQKEAEAVEQGTEAVTSAAQAMEVEQEDWNKKAFVKVDRVDQGSPAEAAVCNKPVIKDYLLCKFISISVYLYVGNNIFEI